MERADEDKAKGKLATFLPVLVWLPHYDRHWFRNDIFAALTITAFSVPNLMAFSQLAGLPPKYGLYAGIGAGLAYFFFGTVRRMIIGPSSAPAILVASVLGVMVVDDPSRYLALAMMTAILVGVIFLIARAIKLGFIVNLVPVPVFKGFLAGLGLTIIVSQLPKLLGVEGTTGDFFTRLFHLTDNLGDINFYTLGLGLLFIGLLAALDRRFTKSPNTLFVVIISIVVMSITDLTDRGVEIVGDISAGLPTPSLPDVTPGDIRSLLALAFSLFVLSFVETTSIGRILESKHAYRMDPNQELVALGASNIAAGVFHGFPVSGSFSRSLLNDHLGAKTQMSGLLSAIFLLVVVLWFTGLFHNMPQMILGVLIIVAVFKLIDFRELHRIRVINETAFAISMVSFGGVLVFGVLEGVVIGVIISFVYVLYKLSSPHVAVLGRIPGTNEFRDVVRHPENITYPGLLLVRVDAPLIFANSHTVKSQITDHVDVDWNIEDVLLDLEASPMLDVTATDMLKELCSSLKEKGVNLKVANPTGEVRDTLKACALDEVVGPIHPSMTVEDFVEHWLKEQRKKESQKKERDEEGEEGDEEEEGD